MRFGPSPEMEMIHVILIFTSLGKLSDGCMESCYPVGQADNIRLWVDKGGTALLSNSQQFILGSLVC